MKALLLNVRSGKVRQLTSRINMLTWLALQRLGWMQLWQPVFLTSFVHLVFLCSNGPDLEGGEEELE